MIKYTILLPKVFTHKEQKTIHIWLTFHMVKDWLISSKPLRFLQGFHKCVEPLMVYTSSLLKSQHLNLFWQTIGNKHDHNNVVLQVVCDTNITFWDVVVLAQGGTHDATHLRTFSLYRGFIHMEILQDLIVTIGNQEVRSYIVVDSTYPPLFNIMKAYPQKKIRRWNKRWFW